EFRIESTLLNSSANRFGRLHSTVGDSQHVRPNKSSFIFLGLQQPPSVWSRPNAYRKNRYGITACGHSENPRCEQGISGQSSRTELTNVFDLIYKNYL
uniref:Uncharacterized protein n=1 Tax=Romanomermis culicivorax TaxID=13658 RepID=A0A915L9P5_ROMCU